MHCTISFPRRGKAGAKAVARPLALAAFAAALAVAAPASTPAPFRDVLDAPAVRTPLAAHALLNGAARAGERLVVVGQRGHVLASDDGGKTWSQAEVPVSSDLVAVSFADADHGWAVGHDGVVLKTADAGRTWSVQLDGRRVGAILEAHYAAAVPATLDADPKRAEAIVAEARRLAAQGAENPWLDVWFRDAREGWVVGAFGLVLHTADGGASWTPWLHAVDNPKGLHLYAVRGVGNGVYMVGEQGLALKLDPAGRRFRALEVPYPGTLFGVTGHGGTVVVHGLRGTVLRSTDAGSTWQPVTTGLQVGLTGSTRTDDGRLVIVSQSGHVLVSRDDGATFTAARVERPQPAAAVVAAAGGALVTAGPRGLQLANH